MAVVAIRSSIFRANDAPAASSTPDIVCSLINWLTISMGDPKNAELGNDPYVSVLAEDCMLEMAR